MTEHVRPARRPSSSFERQAPPAHDVQRCIMPAGRIPRARDDLGDLKRAHPLADVLTSYGVALRGSAPHRMACCPFHADPTPSLRPTSLPPRSPPSPPPPPPPPS